MGYVWFDDYGKMICKQFALTTRLRARQLNYSYQPRVWNWDALYLDYLVYWRVIHKNIVAGTNNTLFFLTTPSVMICLLKRITSI